MTTTTTQPITSLNGLQQAETIVDKVIESLTGGE